MKILFFSHYFHPEGNAPASRTYEHCKRWVAAGHEVTVITCVPNVPNGIPYDGYRSGFRAQKETVDGIRVVRVWTYLAPNKGTGRRIINYLSYMISAIRCGRFRSRPDVIIATSPQFFCGWAGAIVSKLRRIPFILEVRDIWPESILAVGAMKGRPVMIRFLERLEKSLYRTATHIVTVGNGYKQRLLDRGVPVEKLSVLMNGVDKEVFSPRQPDMSLKKELGLDDKFVCSYIGTVGMACGLDVVLRAAKSLTESGRNDIRFLIVGDGAVREELEASSKQQNISTVVFVGRQPKEKMAAYYSISDTCLIHLKRMELFATVMPSKLFEVAAMARPLINGVAGDAAEFVSQAGAGINIEPENDRELVEAVKKLADDPEMSRRFGEAGQGYVLKHFDRDNLAEQYLKIIEKLLR